MMKNNYESDGITDVGDDWLEEFLKLETSFDPNEKAKAIFAPCARKTAMKSTVMICL